MKRILRHYVIDTFSLYMATQIARGIIFEKWPETFLMAGLAVMATSLLAKPVINVLLLPLNLVTFGLFRWVSAAIIFYLVTLIVPGFKIVGFHFAGLTSRWIDIPKLDFSGFFAYVAFAFLFSIVTSFIYWLVK